MNGNNQLRFCEAQMIGAVQHYLDTVLFAANQSPLVAGVDLVDRVGGARGWFVIALKEREPAETQK